jgi:3-polyprenyl-4-hydroxybenzoate decarboxylase
MELTVGITGASGTIYAHRTLQLLAASGAVETINLILSSTASTVAQVEMALTCAMRTLPGSTSGSVCRRIRS